MALSPAPSPARRGLRVALVVVGLSGLFSFWLSWQAGHAPQTAGCDDSAATLAELERLVRQQPAGGGRRAALAAARLHFQLPPQADELPADYLRRTAAHLQTVCSG